jgi:hypothetical protein
LMAFAAAAFSWARASSSRTMAALGSTTTCMQHKQGHIWL